MKGHDFSSERAGMEVGRPLTAREAEQFRSLYHGSSLGTERLRDRALFRR